ncbi:MAG: shikimate kinase [Nitrosomonas sp.]|nr:shikimate kinase [Nitrosomonas sp.]MBK7364672.1 shikimate kinase [Nitrosomonas sp.]
MHFSKALNKRNIEIQSIKKNIFLIGMMGAGKTTIGKSLANYLNKIFVDSDHEIQLRTGVKIPLIFEIEGEAGFRKRETEALRDLVKLENIILATGGGVILNEENRRLLKQNGIVIYLCASVDELLRRTRTDKNRPLLQTEDQHARLTELLEHRDFLYRNTADIIIDSGKQGVRSLVYKLIRKLRMYDVKQQHAAHLEHANERT